MSANRPQPVCDLVVLTYNRLDVTQKFVSSLLANTPQPIRVIFVDNASKDQTPQFLLSLQNTPNCEYQVILNLENTGFIRGSNQGLARTAAPYVCLVNNDILFSPGWLGELIEVFQKNADVGLLNPNSNNLGTRPQSNESLDQLAARLRTRDAGVFAEMVFCIGFCMIFPRKILEDVGGLSEDFLPMFFEDSDFSLRVRKVGYRIGMAKASYVWHEEHASMGQIGGEKERIFQKSRQIFYEKWGRPLRVAWVLDKEGQVDGILAQAAELARMGNHVQLFVPGACPDSGGVFRRNHTEEFCGLDFLGYRSSLALAWFMMVKKKKFDLVIADDERRNRLFKICGQTTCLRPDKRLLEKLKFGGP